MIHCELTSYSDRAETINHTIMIHVSKWNDTNARLTVSFITFVMCTIVCVFADFSSCISSTRMKPSTPARYFPSSSLTCSGVLMVLFQTLVSACLSSSMCDREVRTHSTHALVCLSGVVRLENVPGTLLGILSRWRLFPETIRGPAQLKHTDALFSGGSTRSEYMKFIAAPFLPSDATSFHERTQRLIEEEGSRTSRRRRTHPEEERTLHVSLDGIRCLMQDGDETERALEPLRTHVSSAAPFVASFFSSFGNAPMPQQSYSLYRKISLRKIFHCMFIMQV